MCIRDRGATLMMGILGTITGIFFVDPAIKSLFDQFIGILGMFLGVLAGLFALGATSRRANGPGSLIGALVAIVLMIFIVLAANDKQFLGFEFRSIFDLLGTKIYRVSGYLYAFIGIAICYSVGFVASFLFPAPAKDLEGLVLWKAQVTVDD